MGKPKGKSKKQSPVSKAEDTLLEDYFSCPFCDKTFKNKGTLTRHIKMHDEFRKMAFDDEDMDGDKFPCSQCSIVFAKKNNLLSHMKTHSANNEDEASCSTSFEDEEVDLFPFECPDCCECFSEERLLVAHSKTHNVTKANNGKMCKSTFAHKRDLKRHVITHTSSKSSFKCDFCNATFNNISSQRKHARRHIISCGLCKCSFKSLDEFRTHVMDYHKSNSANAAKRESVSDDSSECSDEERQVDSFAEASGSDSTGLDQTAITNFESNVSKQQNVSFANVSHNLKEKSATECFMCLECQVQFKTKTALQEHSKNCSLLRYICSSPQCNNMVFNNKASFLHHKAVKHQSPQTKEQVPPAKANVNESTKQMLNSTIIPVNEMSYVNQSPSTSGNLRDASSSTIGNETIYVSQKPEMYHLGNNVVSNFVQPNVFNPLMDPLLLATGFVPQYVDATTAYINFNIESYIPWFQKFLNMIESCEYPLQYELFERITHCLKVISNIIGRPLTKMNEQQNFALLYKFHKEFSKISKKHLMHIANDIFK
ncbi:zinc finger protein 33A-like [Uloborus diversus]|uniref:zinc finger protein 33A-like n=1 Tax=Uloborus diversus TaxID=327109 RepID=UPI0024099620|nr:zinc finger protein 33A-like [Uloborus diversus]